MAVIEEYDNVLGDLVGEIEDEGDTYRYTSYKRAVEFLAESIDGE